MKFAHLLSVLFFSVAASAAHALEIKPYSPAALSAAQQAGKPMALHFHADWCPVCRAQDKVFNEFKSDKDLDLTVFTVDYDTEKALRRKMVVHTQSTIIVLKGKTETARLAGDTEAANIKAALQTALQKPMPQGAMSK